MPPIVETRRPPSPTKALASAALSALRSTLVSGAIAVIVAALRHGTLDWTMLKWIALWNSRLFVMVFLGVLVWDYWSGRTKRYRTTYDRSFDAVELDRD